MKNLWIILAPLLVLLIGFIVAIIILFFKRPKHYLAINIILVILVILCIIFCLLPYFKDLAKQQKNVFTGRYAYSVTTGVTPGTKYLKFENDNKEDYIIVPRITREFNLEEGKIYKVTYFINTHVVYSVELIE